MKHRVLALAAAVMLAAVPGVRAQDVARAAIEEAESPSLRPAIPRLVATRLDTLPEASGDRETKEREALRAFYSRPGAKPLWTVEEERYERGRKLAAEIARAGEYGLDAADYALPKLDMSASAEENVVNEELSLSLAALLYTRHAKGGRVDPARVSHQLYKTPELPDPGDVLEALAAAEDPAAYLRSLHPQHPQFERLRKKLAELRAGGGSAKRPTVVLPEGPVLRRDVSHEHVELLRKRLNVKSEAAAKADPAVFDETVETAVKEFQRRNGITADGIVGPGTRGALNGGGGGGDAAILRLLVNMERWRWLPDDLDGEAGIHVWANIPEFRVRVVKGGQVVFNERAIMGLVSKQTPVFSDMMEWIEIHPTWYIPNSIKVDEILPSFRRGHLRVMDRFHLELDCGAAGKDPSAIDWDKVDIRRCSLIQPPGDRSVLGSFKFKFPNEHDVYMHDTLVPRLFNAETRTFSHGCVRIENPRRMAEVLLAHDQNMSSERLGAILAGPRRLHQVNLRRHIPVHITYFTASVDEKGNLATRPDYYGHDRRLAQALTGDARLLPAPPPPTGEPRTPAREREARTSGDDWQRRVMPN